MHGIVYDRFLYQSRIGNADSENIGDVGDVPVGFESLGGYSADSTADNDILHEEYEHRTLDECDA